MGWAAASLPGLAPEEAARLDALPVTTLPRGARVFGPGEAPQGFAMVLSGRIEVSLTGPSGREILLYAVEPGQSCIQTTLGLLGDEPYSGEALCVSDTRIVVIPATLFHALMARSEAFRGFVFRALASRMNDMTALLERVAFTRVEARLAAALLDLGRSGAVEATHAELAARIGSAREVVSRRLEAMAKRGLVATDRGRVELRDPPALKRLAEAQ
ncbi:Crp/Fnr family transcriptional regulator [Pararhodobacter aggregans]|uniref:Crp/Fnr family transcriptional regulator n=1 Tax=Pararhodobacter aggregans TaxID=404875 RepID=A0A2T7UVE8_9RHOB|nr:Crp/Fnr family transcriptional regulator [Pararhodobacter aggregans]PTX03868.1 CRP/FNR family transcriptional regulator [Pararhodobacter aggregans]PVE48652.1 Crp/Fnr family transcriptional regulator [Pararhodobacter aggregans]